jgi:Protein kinase domain
MPPDAAEPDDDSVTGQPPSEPATTLRGDSSGEARKDDARARPDVHQSTTAHEPAAESPETAGGDVDPEATLGAGTDPAVEPVESPGPLAFQREGSGARIGPYTLLQKIGEGGMGIVYLAEQVKPVRRQVALKIIKPGMDTDQIVGRFEAERQALSLMDHQHIARVLDVGTTDAGRPYFVMELVHGVPITQYCDSKRRCSLGIRRTAAARSSARSTPRITWPAHTRAPVDSARRSPYSRKR